MKWLFAVLVLMNTVLFAYFTWLAPLTHDAASLRKDIRPEAIRILDASQLQALSPVGVPAAIPQLACYRWGRFSATEAEKARAVLAQLNFEGNVNEQVAGNGNDYWVYIPPLKNRLEAQRRNDALHAMGIQDTFVVQEARWRYAISLGIFKDEVLASRLAEELRARGVTDVVKDVRNPENSQVTFALDNVPVSLAQALEGFRPDFPRSELLQVPCP